MRLSLTTIVAPLTGAAPVPSISLPPFSTIICFLLAPLSSPAVNAYWIAGIGRSRAAVLAGMIQQKDISVMNNRTKPMRRRVLFALAAAWRRFAVPAVDRPAAERRPRNRRRSRRRPPASRGSGSCASISPAENLSTPMIYVNGAPMTPSQPGTIFYRDFAPGIYTFSVDTCGADINQFPTVQLAPGAQYEFEVQSLQSFTPPDCPRGRRDLLCPAGTAAFPAALPAAARLSRRALSWRRFLADRHPRALTCKSPRSRVKPAR